MNKGHFYIDKKSFCAGVCTTCMFMAILFRLLGSLHKVGNTSWLIVNFAVPAGAALLFIILVALLGNKAYWTTFVPVLAWVGFFIIKSIMNIDNEIVTIAMIVIYLVIGIIYGCTVFGAIGTKWIIAPLFLVPAAYSIAVRDWPVIIGQKTASFPSIMTEMSVICILLGLFFASLGLRKKVVATAEKAEGIVPPIPGGVAVKSDVSPADTKTDITDKKEQGEETKPEGNEA